MSQSKVVELDWRAVLKTDANKGTLAPEPGNAYLLLTNGDWQGCIAHDEFGDRTYWAKSPPAMRGFVVPLPGQDVSDEHALYIQHYLSRIGSNGYQVAFKTEAIHAAIASAAKRNSRHPLREYLSSLTWDGKERLKDWCAECLGSAPSDYVSAVGTWWMISAVARALEPGCQADHMLLLEGNQGSRKSTALRILAGDWYLPELPDVQSKDAAHLLHGRWIVECGELDAMKRSSMTAIKDFITRPIDIYRKPYGRNVVRRPRSVVFAGTTNEYQSLNDPTGARRFWPVRCGKINDVRLREWRDQLWAESVHRFEAGEQWWPTVALGEQIALEQDERFQEDSWENLVLAGAERHALAPFTLSDVMSWIGLPPEKWTKANDTRVGAILMRAGYRSSRTSIGGRKVRYYSNPGLSSAPASNDESDFPE